MKALREAFDKRILVLDGAMGTMIQRLELQEDDYRGELFPDHPSPLQGNHDLLSLTRPEAIADIHRAYFQHVQRAGHLAGRLWHRGGGARHESIGRPDRARGRR
jgi:hypothetical protein